jgi:AcrR family transcriptional regulator
MNRRSGSCYGQARAGACYDQAVTETERPLRADARRNRELIMAAAGELFARLGTEAQMDQIAEHCGLGLGTLYRHFPTKEALLAAIVRQRFEGMAEMARNAEQISEALETFLRTYLGAAEKDAALQLALLRSDGPRRESGTEQKTEFRAIVTRIIGRAAAAGAVRADLTFADFTLITCGAMSVMHFKPAGNSGWRRHLELVLDGIHAIPR